MKRFILATSTMFLLTAGAAMAQNPLNTTAPGASQETKPGQTNNDLQNPGNPQAKQNVRPVTENGTTEGTATESMQRDQGTSNGTTGTTTGTMSNGTTTGTTGTMDNSNSNSGYGTTTGSTTGSTTSSDMSTTSTSTSTTTRSHRLPRTGSEMPLVALIGLASLAAFAGVRASRRNA
jgi:LPXTG-motif cell wall-anchored protein